jgi:hypothetical protein
MHSARTQASAMVLGFMQGAMIVSIERTAAMDVVGQPMFQI